uniref:RNA-directed DNA polymerase, eukaryota n=1 Tax=Tanacetum cinerariifolium TaxID=118510 RepID=A0A6L2MSF4_TANCI|nr:RNA-directed DNA polymerase, eukaryota [Tanacetum cinerariifolium]
MKMHLPQLATTKNMQWPIGTSKSSLEEEENLSDNPTVTRRTSKRPRKTRKKTKDALSVAIQTTSLVIFQRILSTIRRRSWWVVGVIAEMTMKKFVSWHWKTRFMNYLEEQTDREAMINCIKNGLLNDIYSLIDINKTTKDLWDALARHMIGSEYGEQDSKSCSFKCGYSKDNCELNFKFLNNLQPEWKQYATMMRQNKNLMDIRIDALYNILKQNQGDVNDVIGLKKKIVVVTSDPLALIAEKMKVSKKKEKVVVSSDSEGKFIKSNDKKVKKKDDEKKRDMSKVKCYNCKKEGHFAKDCKKVKVKDYEYYKTKMLLAKKDKDKQIEKVLSDSEASSSSVDDKISEVSYYLSEFESESKYESLEYYDNTTTYGLFVNDNDDQEIFHDCENFLENLIESQIDHNESAVDHNYSEGIDKLIRNFNKKIAKCLKPTTFEMKNNELNEQMKVLIEKNDDLLAQTNVLKDQLQVKHVVIDTHVECQEKYAKLNAERYEYLIRYSAYFDNDKQHKKQIADQEILYDKMSVQLVELDKHVRDLKNTILEKDFKISELKECMRNKDLEIEKCLERV